MIREPGSNLESAEYVDGPYGVKFWRATSGRYTVVVKMPDAAGAFNRSTSESGALDAEQCIEWAKRWIEEDRKERV